MFLGKGGLCCKNKKCLFASFVDSSCFLTELSLSAHFALQHAEPTQVFHSGSAFWYQQPGVKVPSLF